MTSETLSQSHASSELSFLVAENLHVSYSQKHQEPTKVLDGIAFGLRIHETVAIVGPNGCGKTTLLLALAGLQPLDQGQILIRGKPPRDVSVGLVFQNYRESLLPWRTIESNVAFSLELKGVGQRDRHFKTEAFLHELNVELPLDHFPYQLSGGQQQTASILRALIACPDLLLLDEPFASLDYRARMNMHQKIQEIFLNTKQTVVFVSHEIDEAILLSDRVLVVSHRPARILASVNVGFSKPRSRELVLKEEFLEVKREVFKHFPL